MVCLAVRSRHTGYEQRVVGCQPLALDRQRDPIVLKGVGRTDVELALLAGDRVAVERRVLRLESQSMRHMVDLAFESEIVRRLEVFSKISDCECGTRWPLA